jgi:branched-chain amino acid transport system permease protein
MDVLIQQLANGIMAGCIYALVAAGVALIFGVLEIPQFALGGMAMLGAYIVYYTDVEYGMSYWAGLLAAVVALAVLGAVAHRLLFHPLRHSPGINGFIVAAGLLLVLESGALIVFGSSYRRVPSPLGTDGVRILGASVTWQRVMVVVVTVVVIGALQLALNRSRIGATIRAVAQNPFGAQVVGINTTRVQTMTMGLGGALAALAGGLIAPIASVHPAMGSNLIVKAFVITILGGMGSVIGAVVGGITFGIVEALGAAYISVDYMDSFGFVILIAVLAIRPHGIFGRAAT